MFNRQDERVVLDTEATLCFSDKKDYICQTLDISLGGIKVSSKEREVYKYIGSECHVKFVIETLIGIEDKRLVLHARARVVNGTTEGIGLRFEKVDRETLAIIEKVVVAQISKDDINTLKGKEGVFIRSNYTKALKAELGEHIIESVKEIFIAFLSIDVVPGPYIERHDFDSYKPPETEVTGIVLFSGALDGGIHLASPLHFAIKAAGAMLDEAGLELEQEQDDMVWDAFGEITNQIAGGVQTRISDEFQGINLTAPNVISGANFQINYSKNLSSVRQFFRTPFGPFFVECFFS